MANSKTWRAWRGEYISTLRFRVNLIPYRARRDTAIYHCSVLRVTVTFMDVVRAAAYYLPWILLFNTSNFAPWPRSFSPFPACLFSYSILRFVTPTRSSGHVRSVRALSFGFQRESSWLGIRSASRTDLGHSAGSDLLNRPRADTAHTPAARAPKRKKKIFSSQLTGRAESARSQSACNLHPTRWV